MIQTSDEVFDLIEQIANTSSTKEKLAMLQSNANSDLLKRVLKATYDPFQVYGVRERSLTGLWMGSSPGAQFSDSNTFDLLDQLANRALTGEAAIAAIEREFKRLTLKSATLLRRILLKNMRAGFSEGSTNKVWKKLIPEFGYMRCSLPKDVNLAEWPWERGIISQEKADGMFANLNIDENGFVNITSRQGTPFPAEHFGEIIDFVMNYMEFGTQVHGEMLVKVDGVIAAREIGNGILNRVLSGGEFLPNEQPIYVAWDQISLEAAVPKGKYDLVPYRDRIANLRFQLPSYVISLISLIDCRVVHSLEEAYAHCTAMLIAGKEGTIIKHPDGGWRDTGSSGSKELVKLKLEFEVDLKVVKVNEGKSKNEGRAGALRCVSSDDKLVVDVAIKNEAMRDAVDAAPEAWVGGIMTVRANAIMRPGESSENYSLFLPRFVEGALRKDKTEADSLERIFEQYEAAKAAGTATGLAKAA